MKKPHPHEIDVLESGVLTEDSSEIARIWITNNAGSSVWIDASAFEDPTVFGYLMADTIRHAACAYATTWSIDESAALQAILIGLSDEMREQFGELTTIDPGGLN